MNARTHRAAGFTLVEMLVVIAIVSVMAAIAVPAFVRVARIANNDLDATARDLQGLLRATKLYAQNYRTETALAYIVNPNTDANPVVDSATGERYRFVEGLVMVRRLHATEPGANLAVRVYTPVQSRNGIYREFRGGGALVYAPLPGAIADFGLLSGDGALAVTEDLGIVGITVVDPNGAIIEPKPNAGTGTNGLRFPAHVFSEHGLLLTDSSKQRFELTVMASPDADAEERFTSEGEAIRERVVLYASLGRVDLAS